MKKWIPVAILGALIAAFYFYQSNLTEPTHETLPETSASLTAPAPDARDKGTSSSSIANVPLEPMSDVEQAEVHFSAPTADAVTYVMEDGVAVVNEDIVVGVPRSAKMQGSVSFESLRLWEDGVVPFHIQGDLEGKERVIQAIAMFADTPIKFVPFSNQADALVFETGSGCKSYLGKVGGHQPIWISPACSSRDIAHEIMHALGFIHEQNRSDRDQFVSIVWENIQDAFKHNFELFPQSLMVLSGQSPFDFESIMLYQATAFGKNSHEPTILPKTEGKIIAPGAVLSAADTLRLERVYGSR